MAALAVAGYLLSVVDTEQAAERREVVEGARRARAELSQVEDYYDRAGEKTGRLVYFWGMMIGVAALAVMAVAGVLGLFAASGFRARRTRGRRCSSSATAWARSERSSAC